MITSQLVNIQVNGCLYTITIKGVFQRELFMLLELIAFITDENLNRNDEFNQVLLQIKVSYYSFYKLMLTVFQNSTNLTISELNDNKNFLI